MALHYTEYNFNKTYAVSYNIDLDGKLNIADNF